MHIVCALLRDNVVSKGFNWDDLRYFLAVARAETVSLASRRMGVDHATVIRRVEGLERALGAKLFERTPRGYNLTQTGHRLLSSAHSIEAEILQAEQQLAGRDAAISGLVRISTLEGFGNFFLAKRLPAFACGHPGLSVELVTIQQIVALSRREADIAVTLQAPPSGPFVSERLTDYSLLVYGAQSYLEQHAEIRTRADLRAHRFIGYIDDLIFARGLDYLSEIDPNVRPRLQSSSLHAQMETALGGYGLCVLPTFIADHQPQLVRVLPAEISLRRTYWLVLHKDTAETARIQAARRFIVQEVRAAQDLFV
jgi:DNA-binding transcriptional LysR family regulator